MRNKLEADPVLIIEDDHRTRNEIRTLLELDGYSVITASDSGDALRKLHAGLRPCLILLDLMLPDMDGFEFRRTQVEEPEIASIPVAVYAAHFPSKPQLALLGSGYFERPIEFSSLLQLVAAHCKPKPQRKARSDPRRQVSRTGKQRPGGVTRHAPHPYLDTRPEDLS